MGTPSPGWDLLVRQASVAVRRRRRRRRQRRMLWLLTGATTAVLVAIALFIMHISKVPTKVRPAALSASAQTVSHPKASATAHRAKPSPRSRHTVTYPRVVDASSGLSYRMFGAPWRSGCPSDLNTSAFDWTAGENTVAGHVSIGGSVIDWHGLACSGQLQQQFPYAGPADLKRTAMSLVGAIDPGLLRRGAALPRDRGERSDSGQRAPGLDRRLPDDLLRRREPGPDLDQRTGRRGGRRPRRGPDPRRVLRLGARQPRHPEPRHAHRLAPGRLALRDVDVAAAAAHRDPVAGMRVGRDRHLGAVVAARGGAGDVVGGTPVREQDIDVPPGAVDRQACRHPGEYQRDVPAAGLGVDLRREQAGAVDVTPAGGELPDVAEVAGGQVAAAGVFFFFNDTATTEIYTLSLHDALPI